MIRFKALIMVLFFPVLLLAQEGLPYYNTYLLGDEYILHPSTAGRSICGDLSFSVRQQWFGHEDHPASYIVSFNRRIGQRRGIGGYILHDRNGPTRQTKLQLTYNHHLIFSGDEVGRPHRLQMALSGQLLLFNYNNLGRFLPLNSDPILTNNNYTNLNANVSVSYLRGFFRASLTANSLIDFYSKDDGIEEPTNLRNYIGTIEYKFKPSDLWSITPTMTYILEQSQRRDLLDIGAKFSYALNPETRFWARASYRGYISDERGFESIAFTPIVGIDKGSWKLAYSYDVDLGEYGAYYRGGHQIRLGIKLFCQNTCRCDYDEW